MKQRRQLLVVALAAVGVLAALAAIYVVREGKPGSLLRPHDERLVAQGRQVYAAHCAACHGLRLEGAPNWRSPGPDGRFPAPPHDASGHTWHHTDELLFRITKFGVAKAANLTDHQSAMPAFEGQLSDEDIVAALSWIKSQWPPRLQAQHDLLNKGVQP